MRLALFIVTCISITCLSTNSQAQEKQNPYTKRVLLVPFNRFELHTEIELSLINKANNIKQDEFYPNLLNAFHESFILNSNDQVTYHVIKPEDYKELIKYVNQAVTKGHFESFLNDLEFKDYKAILNAYDCEYVLFINWYRIKDIKRSIKIEKLKHIERYSEHSIDYDVFNANKNNVLRMSAVKFEVEITEDNYKKLGVRLKDMPPVYKKLVDQISVEILNVNN